MIEILNVNAVNKGALLATCDVRIVPWKMTLKDVKIFEKGANKWISMPSKEFINEMAEKKYIELISFDNEAIKTRFRDQIMEAIDAYMMKNPDLKTEDVIKDTEELPF